MSVLQRLKSWGRLQSFQPGPLAIFVNPLFFIRRGLYRGVKKNASQLSGIMLDFGCGRKPYKRLFNVDQYVGVDIEQSGHSHEISEVDVYYDGKTIPFDSSHFDSVFCSEVFEHVFEIDMILDEINRVLKPGGKMLVTVPFVWSDHEVPYDYGRYSTYGLTYLLEKHGFDVLSVEKSTNFVETIVQLWMLYIYHVISGKSPVINTILNVLFIFPFALLGLMVSYILPKRKDLYHNNIVLVRKK